MSSDKNVVISPEAHKPRLELMKAPVGCTMTEILRCAMNEGKFDKGDLPYVEIRVNGKLLPRREDALDRCLLDGEVVQISMAVRGDNPLKTAFQLIVQVTAIVVGFYFGPWAAAAVQVVGALATAALFRNKQDRLSDPNSSSALNEQSNTIRRRAPMPLVLGRQRVAFDVAALSYTQNIGNDSWLNVIFGVHYGPCTVEQIKIGETLLADYPASDVQIEYSLNPGPKNFNLYPGNVFQENFNNKLDFVGIPGGTWETVTPLPGARAASLDITLPGGLSYSTDKGKIRNEEVAGQIQIAEVGTENWQAAPFPGNTTARNKNGQLLPPGSFYINMRTANAIRQTYTFNLDPTKNWKVRVRAYDQENDSADDPGHTWDTYLTALRSHFDGKPIIDENLSCIAIRIKASGDLSNTLPTISGIVTPIVPVYKNGNWDTREPSSNQAALLRWCLTDLPAAKPMPASEINSSCEAVYNLIQARDWGCALHITDDISQEDLMRLCGLAGRFATYWSGEDLCFVGDWEKPIARQVFSAANIKGYKYRREFQDEIHAVLVEFKNLDQDSRTDEVWVYADGYNANNSTLFETYTLQFACSQNRAYREGRVYLARRELKTETHEWTAGFDSVTSTFGDRVRVSHYAALYGEDTGRVVNRILSADQQYVLGVRLDFAVQMEVGQSYSLDVRRYDQALVGIVLEPATKLKLTKSVYFSVPLEVNAAPRKDDLVVFGKTNLVTEDVEIDSFDPQSRNEVRISASPYVAAQIEAAETGPIPPLPTNLKPKERTPRVRILQSYGKPEGVEVVFDVAETSTNPIQGFIARWRYSGGDYPWNTLAILPKQERTVRTPPILRPAYDPDDPIDAVTLIDVQIITLSQRGDYSNPTTVSAIQVKKEVAAPTGFDAMAVVRTAPDGSSKPAIAVIADPVTAGDIQYLDIEIGPIYEGAVYLSAGSLSASNPIGDFFGVDPGEDYVVRGRFRTQDNWYSEWVYKGAEGSPVVIPGGSNVSSDSVKTGGVNSTFIAQLYQVEFPAALLDLEQARNTLYTAQTGLVDQTANLFNQLNTPITGLVDRTANLFNQLNTPTTGVLARLQHIETVQQDDNSAAVRRLDALEATVNTAGTGVVARLATAESAIATNNSAAVQRLNAIEANINTAGTGLLARMATAESAITTNNSAAAQRLNAIEATVNTAGTGVVSRLATAESAIATNNSAAVGRLDALEATVNTAGTGVVARLATAESAIATNNSAAVNRLNAIESNINTAGTGLLARMATQENVSASLQTGKADVSRVSLLEARGVVLPNLIEDGRFNKPLGQVWYKEGGEGPTIEYDKQIGSFLRSPGPYLVSKEYPCSEGAILSVAWSGVAANPNAHLYIQVLPTYQVIARAYRNAANNWGQRYYSDGSSTPAPAGTTSFRVVIDPSGGSMDVSSVKVNYGGVGTFWTDELTFRSQGASISTLETVTNDLQNNKASAQRVSLLEAGSDDVFFTKNSSFSLYTNDAQTGFTTPEYWYPWGEKTNDSHRVPGTLGPWAWWSHNNAGGGIGTGELGIQQDYNNNPRLANMSPGIYVLEADFRLEAGQIGGAGVLAYFPNADSVRINFAIDDKPVGRDTPLGLGYDTPGFFSFRKLVKITNVGAGGMIFHLMTEWGGFENGARPKVIKWERCGIRLATPQEVAAERADTNAGSALARVQTVEDTTAELVARGDGGGNLVGNALLLNTVGWTISLPNNAESTLDRASTGINFPPGNNWHPAGENCLTSHVNAPDSSWYMDWFSDGFALEPGKTYEFGARAGQHRCETQVYIQVTNVDTNEDGYYQASLYPNGGATATEAFAGGKNLAGYAQFWGKFTVPPGFSRGRMILRRFSTGPSYADSWSWFTRPFCREIPSTQTRPSPWDSGASQWNLKASWAVGVSVPGADAFMEARAQLADGQSTSSVALGAKVITLYNQVDRTWVKTLETVNGNAIFYGGLQAGAFIRLGNGNGWPVALKPVDFNLSDGEVVSFGTDLGALPALSFALNNLAPLNAGETYDIKPINLTATGFTLSAKINIPATPSNQSMPAPGSTGSVDGIAVRFATLDGRPESADGTYTIQTAGYTSVRVPRNTQVTDYEGSGTIRVWALKNGAWVVVALIPYNWYELFGNPSNQDNNQQASWSTYDTIQMGSGVQGIAVGLPSPTESIGRNAALSSFGPTDWQAQGSGSGVRSATPNGQKTRVSVRPQ